MINEALWHGIEILTTLFEIIVYYMFLRDFLGDATHSKKNKLIGAGIFFLALVMINFIVPIPSVALLLCISGIFLLSFLFDGDIKLKVFATILMVAFLIVSEMITLFGLMAFGNNNAELILNQGNLRLLGIIISKTVLLILTKMVSMFRNKSQAKIPIIYWLALLSISFFSLLTMYVIIMFNIREGNSDITYVSFAAGIGLLYSNIMLFFLFEAIVERTAIKMNNKLLEQQIEYQMDYYHVLEQSQNKIRTLRHDMKNHLLCILHLIEGGKEKEASEYVKKISEATSGSALDVVTGNPVIDSLLTHKINKAHSEGIEVAKTITVPAGMNIEPVDACVIFGNALDNAIEACNRIKKGNKKMDITLKYTNRSLFCEIANSTDGALVKLGKYFMTSKGDKEYHGLGLKNISSCIEKYKGIANMEHSDNVFKLSFVLNNV